MNIAIFTPNKNPYSETFIQAHKQYLKGKVFFYYGTKGRIQLEGVENLVSKRKHWQYRIKRKLKNYPNSYFNDQAVLNSLKTNDVKVVLIEYGTHANNLLAILKESRLPIVVHFHGYDASVHEVIERCNEYQEVFSMASKIVVVSRAMEKKILELGCPKEKLVHNVYGPQPEFENVIPTFDKKQFVAIGRFTNKKAPYYTLLAFKEVVQKYSEARLIMAGTGELLDCCKNLARYYNIEKHVYFAGVVSQEQYRSYLAESIAFVQHSITAENGDMEGTPLAVLEASYAGLPVISTNHAGIPDVIIHNQTGLLCEEHDVAAMVAHMIRLLDNPAEAQSMGTAGKEYIRENFSLERHIAVLQALLDAK